MTAMFLAGCQSASTVPAGFDPPEPARIPHSLKIAPPAVSQVPTPLPLDAMPKLWMADRRRLGVCVQRHAALARAVDALERQFEQPDKAREPAG